LGIVTGSLPLRLSISTRGIYGAKRLLIAICTLAEMFSMGELLAYLVTIGTPVYRSGLIFGGYGDNW
jgi:hypothetical protein